MQVTETAARSVDDLYAALANEVERLVQANVRAEADVITEACQSAWESLLAKRQELTGGTELGWLVVTATREALRLIRDRRRALSLEQEREQGRDLPERSTVSAPQDIVELRERLAEVGELPARQRRVVMLQGFGYRYAEIADFTGQSRRTVERQLLRARRRLAS